MKNIFLVSLLGTILTACGPASNPTTVQEAQLETTLRVIISAPDLKEVQKQVGPEVTKVSKNQASFELSLGQIKQLQKTIKDIKIEEDMVFSLPPVKQMGKPSGGTTQPAQVVPWGVNAVKAPLATNRGQGVRVCVVDTGLDVTHPDLNPLKVKALGVPGLRNKSSDDNGHGTHVSGTIAAQDNLIGVVGVAPEVELVSVKALNRQGSGYSSDLANAIDVCIAQGTQVINASWGSAGYSSVIAAAVTRATNQGIYFVAAAGNESTVVSYPAALSNAVAISAVDSAYNFAYFSNSGPEVDYAAPGVAVLSTLPGGKYASWSGTSMATPHAVAVIAIMISAGNSQIGTTVLSLPANQQGQGLVDAQSSSL